MIPTTKTRRTLRILGATLLPQFVRCLRCDHLVPTDRATHTCVVRRDNFTITGYDLPPLLWDTAEISVTPEQSEAARLAFRALMIGSKKE